MTTDGPSGRVEVRVRPPRPAAEGVTFRNVAALMIARAEPAGGGLVDVAYGRAVEGFVPAERWELRVAPGDLPEDDRCRPGVQQHLRTAEPGIRDGTGIAEQWPVVADCATRADGATAATECIVPFRKPKDQRTPPTPLPGSTSPLL